MRLTSCSFQFDHVFPTGAGQGDVFDFVAPLVSALLEVRYSA